MMAGTTADSSMTVSTSTDDEAARAARNLASASARTAIALSRYQRSPSGPGPDLPQVSSMGVTAWMSFTAALRSALSSAAHLTAAFE